MKNLDEQMCLNSCLVKKLKLIGSKKFRQINGCQKIQLLGTIHTGFEKVWSQQCIKCKKIKKNFYWDSSGTKFAHQFKRGT